MVSKLGASCVIIGVLAAQLFALSPAGRGGWYWPFVDFPMYSAAKKPGATFGLFDLEAVACNGAVRGLTNADLHLPPFRFRNVVEVAAGGRPDRPRTADEIPAARAFLGRVVADEVPGDWCMARIGARIYTMGEHGLESADVPRRVAAEWTIGGGAAR